MCFALVARWQLRCSKVAHQDAAMCAVMVGRAMHTDAGEVNRSGAVWSESGGRSDEAQIRACREHTPLSAPGKHVYL